MLFPLCVLGCYWLVLIYQLGAQWSLYEQYNYGWAVPFLCAWLLWRRWQGAKSEEQWGKQKAEIRNRKLEDGRWQMGEAEGEGRPSEIGGPVKSSTELHGPGRFHGPGGAEGAGESEKQKAESRNQEAVVGKQPSVVSLSAFQHFSFQRLLSLPSPIFYLLLLGLCALLYAPTRFVQEANPVWRLTSLLWTLEVIGITLLTIHLVLGKPLADHGPRTTETQKAESRKQKVEMADGEGQRTTDHGPRISSSRFQLSAFSFQLSDFSFPVCFFLVAVPWPSAVENWLVQWLMQLNVSMTVGFLGLFGIPAMQHGNVVEISTGVVGIDEACSGIRSLQATLMLSLFFGELYRLTASRRVVLVLCGALLAFIFNVGRTFLLVAVASAKGVPAVASWHDPAGVVILVACFVCLWAIGVVLSRNNSMADGERDRPGRSSRRPADEAAAGIRSTKCVLFGQTGVFGQRPKTAGETPALPFRSESSQLDTRAKEGEEQGEKQKAESRKTKKLKAESGKQKWEDGSLEMEDGREGEKQKAEMAAGEGQPSGFSIQHSAFSISWVAVGLAAWLVVVEAGTEIWYRLHEAKGADNTNWSVDLAAASARVTKVEVPSAIRGQFRYDQGVEGRWQGADGALWQLYYFRWLPGRSLRSRVRVQLGKSHGPEKCLPAVGMRMKADVGTGLFQAGGFQIALRQYRFDAEGRPLDVFYGIYEDPTGGALANRRLTAASRVEAALAGSRNYGQRFLEVAVFGYEKPEDARMALARELAGMIKVGEGKAESRKQKLQDYGTTDQGTTGPPTTGQQDNAHLKAAIFYLLASIFNS